MKPRRADSRDHWRGRWRDHYRGRWRDHYRGRWRDDDGSPIRLASSEGAPVPTYPTSSCYKRHDGRAVARLKW